MAYARRAGEDMAGGRMDAEAIIVVVLVVVGRLLLPLGIPYFPVPALISCLVLDTIDQTIFQQFPSISLAGYQQYDKALDIYYLTIAYLSTLRNWTNQPALLMARFLFYYRLVGDLLFELSEARWLLFVFPNTFEYFFLFYELCRLRWRQARMTKRVVIVSAVCIWVFIKLPQEWWIHLAKLDVTDSIGAYPWVLAPLAVGAGVLFALAWWVVFRKAPPADGRAGLRADPLPPQLLGGELYRMDRLRSRPFSAAAGARTRLFDRALAEKAVLVALIVVVFSQIMPRLEAGPLVLGVSVAVFVVIQAFVSQWLARRGRGWRSVALEFAVMTVVNFGIVAVIEIVDRVFWLPHVRIPLQPLLFVIFLETLLIVLFDRFHTVFVARPLLAQLSRVPVSGRGPSGGALGV